MFWLFTAVMTQVCLSKPTDRFKETFDVTGEVTYDDEGPAIFTTDDSTQILSIDDETMTDLLENNKPVIFVFYEETGCYA